MRQSSIDREARRAVLIRQKKRQERIQLAIGLIILVPALLVVAAFALGGLLWGALWFWTHLPL